jgi:hypothetical protein
MINPFDIAFIKMEALALVQAMDLSPAKESNSYLWLNAPNPLLSGITPLIYIEMGHGDKLIKMLKEKLSN